MDRETGYQPTLCEWCEYVEATTTWQNRLMVCHDCYQVLDNAEPVSDADNPNCGGSGLVPLDEFLARHKG
jgi:hypothetical protein